jgi:hypothetical protein
LSPEARRVIALAERVTCTDYLFPNSRGGPLGKMAMRNLRVDRGPEARPYGVRSAAMNQPPLVAQTRKPVRWALTSGRRPGRYKDLRNERLAGLYMPLIPSLRLVACARISTPGRATRGSALRHSGRRSRRTAPGRKGRPA